MSSSGFSVIFVGNSCRDGHVEYQLKISRPEGESWELQKRYSQMRDLHDLLKLRIPAINSLFPPKKLFGNTDPGFIAQRQTKLQQYLAAVLKHDPKIQLQVLKDFLEVRELAPPPIIEEHHVTNTDEAFISTVNVQLIDLSQAPHPLDATEVEHRQSKYRLLVSDALKHPVDPAIMVLAGDMDGPRTTTPTFVDPHLHSANVKRDGEILQTALANLLKLGKHIHRIPGVDRLIIPFPQV